MPLVVKDEMITQQFGISELDLKLKNGSLALFPTDTLPALCSYPKYSKKIWTIKKRPSSKPLILMGGCLDDLFEFVNPCAKEEGFKLAKIYWPGALTMVLPTIGNVSENLNCYSNSQKNFLLLAKQLLMLQANRFSPISSLLPRHKDEQIQTNHPSNLPLI